ncbi:calcium release-activated calcium channel protein 1-like [Montipora capricornis]|uniref:calcium release-activated calcium channel protein 1-like n=1 Tax=Montipora foliosa TaxID=591990 RepID=UPI0035F1F5CD
MKNADEESAQKLTVKRLFLTRGKLKASSRTSALMSGFAMVAMVELQVEDGIPDGLLIAFSVMTTVLISVHVFALMISVCILPNIDGIANIHQYGTENMVKDSPHEKLHTHIETAWIFSTGLGTLLFLAEIAILSWVKFYLYSKPAAVATSVVLLPVCIVFVWFAVHFYRTLVQHKYERSFQGVEELQQIAIHLHPDGGTLPSTPSPSPQPNQRL